MFYYLPDLQHHNTACFVLRPFLAHGLRKLQRGQLFPRDYFPLCLCGKIEKTANSQPRQRLISQPIPRPHKIRCTSHRLISCPVARRGSEIRRGEEHVPASTLRGLLGSGLANKACTAKQQDESVQIGDQADLRTSRQISPVCVRVAL